MDGSGVLYVGILLLDTCFGICSSNACPGHSMSTSVVLTSIVIPLSDRRLVAREGLVDGSGPLSLMGHGHPVVFVACVSGCFNRNGYQAVNFAEQMNYDSIDIMNL